MLPVGVVLPLSIYSVGRALIGDCFSGASGGALEEQSASQTLRLGI